WQGLRGYLTVAGWGLGLAAAGISLLALAVGANEAPDGVLTAALGPVVGLAMFNGWYEDKLFVWDNQAGKVVPLRIVYSEDIKAAGLKKVIEQGLESWREFKGPADIDYDNFIYGLEANMCLPTYYFLLSDDNQLQGYMQVFLPTHREKFGKTVFISLSIKLAPWNEPRLHDNRRYKGIHHQIFTYFMKVMTDRYGKIMFELLTGNCPLIARLRKAGVNASKYEYG
ncbi:unnamed protein product, partial [marine sediment metagenome]